MTTDPRAALDRLIAALEAHLEAASRRRSETDPAVVAVYQTLADAFETYDEALYAAFDEVTPFVLYDDSEDEAEDDLDEDEEIDEDDLGEDDPFDDQVELDDDDDSDDDESEDDLDEDDAVSVDDGTGSAGSSGSR